MEIAICLIVGFFASLIVVKLEMKKSGAGKCKMCKSCDFYLDFQKKENQNDEVLSDNV